MQFEKKLNENIFLKLWTESESNSRKVITSKIYAMFVSLISMEILNIRISW
jgi:hypothetical protein